MANKSMHPDHPGVPNPNAEPDSEFESGSQSEFTRRNFLKGGVALGGISVMGNPPLAAAINQAEGSTTDGKKPNILIIISDQLNIDALSCYSSYFKDRAYGGHWAKTPHLDRLAQEGFSFIESHAGDPVCSPSRSCMFTGRMAVETGVITINIGIDKTVPNMGQWFERHSDYNRVYCGKWHIGGRWNYPDVSGPRKIPGFETIPVGGSGMGIYTDPQVSNSAASYIANYREDKPYLLVASLMNPHDICYWMMKNDGNETTPEDDVFELGSKLPVLPPNYNYSFKYPPGLEPYKAFHSHTQWQNYGYDYYRMVEDIDEHVGRIMNAVRKRNDDTVVVFVSDHGEALGRHRLTSKWHPYEPSVKVPFLLWSPKRIKANVLDTEHLVSNVDMMPTLCDYAGIAPPPHCRGYSVRQIVDQGSAPTAEWRDNVYAGWQFTGRLIRTRKYKYVMKYRYSGDLNEPFVRKSDGAHTQFVQGHGEDYAEFPEQLLFDIANDPWELNNLIGQPGSEDIVAEHRGILRDWEAKLIVGRHYDRN